MRERLFHFLDIAGEIFAGREVVERLVVKIYNALTRPSPVIVPMELVASRTS